jgi:DNA-binding NtrC family response regulator
VCGPVCGPGGPGVRPRRAGLVADGRGGNTGVNDGVVTTFAPKKRTAAGDAGQLSIRVVFSGERIVLAEPVVVDGSLWIGRDVVGAVGADALCIADDRALSRRHARLERANDGHWWLVDTSSHGSRVNGVDVDERAVLSDGAIVRVGDSMLVVRMKTPAPDAALDELKGVSSAARRLRATLASLAPTTQTVLVLGASGAGKEVCAQAVHRLSGRTGAFVAINSAALPEHLLENELFGHATGAFTGGRGHLGAFRAAQGGTLFLDEIGELSPAAQAKLLRVLEAKEVTPLGSTTPVKLDVRVVAATHQDLVARVKQGAFRADLYARLAEIVVRVPPLSERRDDIMVLLHHFLGRAARLDGDLAEALVLHPWPLQVRELRRIAMAMLLLPADRLVTLDDVGALLDEGRLLAAAHDTTTTTSSTPTAAGTTVSTKAAATTAPPDRDGLVALLQKHRGNVLRIAQETGRSRKQVYRWLEQHDLDAETFRDA